MSHLEGIEKLKEEVASSMRFLKAVHSTSGKEPFDRMMDLIDRAFSLGGKSVVAQLLEAVPEREVDVGLDVVEDTKHALKQLQNEGWNQARQALIAKAIQLGVMEKDV